MLKKDSFIVGFIGALLIFIVLYSILNLFTDFAYFSQSRDSLWVYMLSLIPDLILARFMLVKWNKEKTGKGMMLVTLLGIILVMFVLR
ncbi:MAG: hypothetical protein J6U85_01330 [Bacteroidales bacterium]|jgi:hypothetical protein|nr:hypothetical protein [Bacteroidales bacterium]